MKKKFYFATLVIALLSFTGCANDEYVGDQQNPGEQNGAIAFSTKSENTVRATEWTGSNAADRLNKQFWVYGTKTGNAITTPLVFDNYRVEYTGNTSGPYSPKGWEYVGKGGNDKPQTIKYWDYSADKYEFEAYSYNSSTGSVTRITENDVVNKLDAGDYQVTEAPEDLYFAQKNTMSKPTPAGTKYDVVTLTFKSVLSKIRVGFYETIPDYSVKIDKFYGPNGNTNGWDEGNTSAFVAWCPNKEVTDNHPFVVKYVTDNDADPAVTKPTVTKVAEGTNSAYIEITNNSGPESYKLDAKLTLGSNLLSLRNGDKPIGDTYSKVTWDNIDVNNNNNPIYTYFIPQEKLWNVNSNESKVQPMKIKVDYTLTSDKDNSGEKIVVKGATAIVPGEYLKWAPNTAYSYVFRISERTNGNTGTPGTDPAGLYPITFDAAVTEMEENNNYLTTVSELSITATQDGVQFANADEAVFKTGDPIKVKVMQYMTEEGVLKAVDRTNNVGTLTPEAGDSFTAVFKTSYDPNKSLEEYLNGQGSEHEYVSPEYIKLLSKDEAGYWIVKVTYNDNGTNITKYAVLKVG